MKRYAFTMLELIFVIVVLGILAVLAMPRFERDPLGEAARHFAQHIRYTQHLAMVDDRYSDTNSSWYKERWQIRLTNDGTDYFYDVFSDKNHEGNSDEEEEAIDPLTHERLGTGAGTHPTDAVNLTKKYQIDGIGGTCTSGGALKVVFDSLGRPYTRASAGVYSNPVPTAGCTFILKHATDGNVTIRVYGTTGYVDIEW